VIATVLVYAPVRHYGFVPLDDPHYIVNNPHVLAGLTSSSLAWAFSTGYAANWHPLTWMSFMTEIQLFGLRPEVQHITNVLLHIANALLLFGWLRRTTGALGRSACVAALFAVHPLHVESVAWITERKDVLSTFFWMLTLWAYVGYVRRPGASRYLLALLCFAAGLMAKPMVVTLPFVLLLVDAWPLDFTRGRPLDFARGRPLDRGGATWGRLVREKIPFMMLAVASSLVTLVVQQNGGAMVTSQIFPLGLRVENAIVSPVAYLWQAIWPVDLIVWYPYAESIPLWQVGAALLVLASISVAVVRLRRFPYLAVGWLWYLGTLVPVIGLVQVGLQPRADRYTYIPLIGINLMLAWGAVDLLARWKAGRPALAAAAMVVTIAYAVGAHRQVGYWQDGVTLWGHAAEVTSGTGGAQAQFEFARALADAGRIDEAIAHFGAALQAKPDWGAAHGLRGIELMRAGRKTEARDEYETALRLEPAQPEIQTNLGVVLANDGHLTDALPYFVEAVRLKPDFEAAHANLGVAFARLGRRDEAIQEFRTTLQLNPNNAIARQMLASLDKGK
jgi:protein O-mannosyl-transferase